VNLDNPRIKRLQTTTAIRKNNGGDVDYNLKLDPVTLTNVDPKTGEIFLKKFKVIEEEEES
jgi:hypothetical protein